MKSVNHVASDTNSKKKRPYIYIKGIGYPYKHTGFCKTCGIKVTCLAWTYCDKCRK